MMRFALGLASTVLAVFGELSARGRDRFALELRVRLSRDWPAAPPRIPDLPGELLRNRPGADEARPGHGREHGARHVTFVDLAVRRCGHADRRIRRTTCRSASSGSSSRRQGTLDRVGDEGRTSRRSSVSVALDETLRATGHVEWNKFLLVVTLEPYAEPADAGAGRSSARHVAQRHDAHAGRARPVRERALRQVRVLRASPVRALVGALFLTLVASRRCAAEGAARGARHAPGTWAATPKRGVCRLTTFRCRRFRASTRPVPIVGPFVPGDGRVRPHRLSRGSARRGRRDGGRRDARSAREPRAPDASTERRS